MPVYYHFLIPLLSLFFVRVDLTDLLPLRLSVKVLKVYDGDTVLVAHGSYQWRLRFSKIDAPEKGQRFLAGSGDAGLYSRECLRTTLEEAGELTARLEKLDIYGRLLGDLNQVSLSLVRKGCVALYPYATFDSRQEKRDFLITHQIARHAYRGLWGRGGILRPQLWRKLGRSRSDKKWVKGAREKASL